MSIDPCALPISGSLSSASGLTAARWIFILMNNVLMFCIVMLCMNTLADQHAVQNLSGSDRRAGRNLHRTQSNEEIKAVWRQQQEAISHSLQGQGSASTAA